MPADESDGPPLGCCCTWRLVTMVDKRMGMGWIRVEESIFCRRHSGKPEETQQKLERIG